MGKKIAIISNTSWNLYNFRLSLMKAMRSTGYDVIAIAPYDQYSEYLKRENFEYYNINIDNKGTNPINDLKTTFEFYQLYRKLSPEVILNYTIKPNIYGTIAANLLGIKAINNISGLGTLFIKENLFTKVAKNLYRYSQKRAFRVFFQNSDDFKLFLKNKLVRKEQCDQLPGSGIDLTKFKPVKEIKKDNSFIFLLVSRVLWDKGIGEYIEAIRILKQKYPHVKYQLLGSVDVQNKTAISKKQIDEWCKDGLIDYLGVTDDVKEYITSVDCVVLPSYREGTPRSLLEAASMEKPVITTDTVGCKDVVDDGQTGFLCKVKSGEDLAAKMDQMISLSRDERVKMGRKGREKMVREYDEKIVIQKYLETLSQITKK